MLLIGKMKKLNNLKTYLPLLLSIVLIMIFSQTDLSAQCSMCRMAAESNLEHGGSSGRGLNVGILYMLIIPYLSVGVIGYILYKRRITKRQNA